MVSHILNKISRFLLAVWAGTVCVVIGSLMVGHWVSLPHPEIGSRLSVSGATDAEARNDDLQIRTFHFLYSDCACSRRVLKHVCKRDPFDRANEKIVLVGAAPKYQEALIEKGFEVEVVTQKELNDKYGIESAPLLVITDHDDTIRYSGGYTSRKQGLDYQDVDIIQRTMAGESVEGLPLYGCAVSKGLQAIVDPLKLKY